VKRWQRKQKSNPTIWAKLSVARNGRAWMSSFGSLKALGFFLEFDQPITDPKIVRDHITHHLLNMDVEQLHTVLRLLRALTGGFSQ
jgi:hypothetical protein